LRAGAIGAGTALARPALTQETRPIRWIVAYPAGGGTDNIARTLSGADVADLGQTIVIDNRPALPRRSAPMPPQSRPRTG
jgi:tripartite-type tricarboxylate transporter receptor subunit TctC